MMYPLVLQSLFVNLISKMIVCISEKGVQYVLFTTLSRISFISVKFLETKTTVWELLCPNDKSVNIVLL